jgi:large subunit ribosomal protein L13
LGEDELSEEKQPQTVIDASGLIVGRMASIIAKRLLLGESIIVVNAEKAVISGRRLSRVKEAKKFLEVGHPGKGPFHPRRPDQIIRKTIRGMLPRRLPKGQAALRRLRVFLGLPEEIKALTLQSIPEANASKLRCSYVTVGEFAKEIGYKSEGM